MRSALKPSRETDGIKDMIVDFHRQRKRNSRKKSALTRTPFTIKKIIWYNYKLLNKNVPHGLDMRVTIICLQDSLVSA